MKVLNSRPHGGILHEGKIYPPGTPVEMDDEDAEKLIAAGSHVKATPAVMKAAEAALAPDEEEVEEEVEETDAATGQKRKVARKVRRKKASAK